MKNAISFCALLAAMAAFAEDKKDDDTPSTGNTQAGVVTKGVEDIGYRQDWKKQEQANEQMNKEFQEQQNIDQRYVKEAYEDVNKHQSEVNRNETEYNNSKKEYETNRQAEIDAGKKSADAEASASTAEREANKLEKEAANAKKNKDPNAAKLENQAKKARENAGMSSSPSSTSAGDGKINGTYSSSGGPLKTSEYGAWTCAWCGKKTNSSVSGVGGKDYCSNACYNKFLESRRQNQGTQSRMRERPGDHRLRDPLSPAPDYRGVR